MGHLAQLKKFYKNKNVFITGHTGFKGSWLCLVLKELQANITGYALPPENISLFELADIKKDVNSILGDIRNYDDFFDAIKKSSPEIILHLAAQPLVRESYYQPVATYQTNVMGTINLLEATRKVKTIKTIVNVTTDKCYENKNLDIAFKEDDKLGGHDPYSSSKACSEIVTSCWRDSFLAKENIAIASARAGNVIGGGDFSADRIIPDIVRAILQNQKVTLRNPLATRPWQHVLEPIIGYLILAMKLSENPKRFSSAYNFGPELSNIKDVETICESFIKKIGQGSYGVKPDENLYEAKTLKLDNNKAKSELGWQPIFNFNQTIDFTVDWYLEYILSRKPLKDFTLKQIQQYLN